MLDLPLALAFDLPSWDQLWPVLAMVGFVVSCVFLILAVLVQKPQGGGLAGAFGSGAGSGQTAFGTRTGDALTWITISFFTLYIVMAVVLNYVSKPAKGPVQPPAISAQPGSGATQPAGTAPASTTPASTTPATTPTTPGASPAPAAPATSTPASTPTPSATPTPAPVEPAPATPAPATPAPTPAPTTTPPTGQP